MYRILAVAMLFFVMHAATSPSQVLALQLPHAIDQSGPGHNGVRLRLASLTEVQTLGGGTVATRVTFEIECRKNHGGNVSGSAVVVMADLVNDDGIEYTRTLSCSKDGPNHPLQDNSNINKEVNSVSLLIRMGRSQVIENFGVIGKVERNTREWFDNEWRKIEERLGDLGKQALIDIGMKLIPLSAI